MDSCVNGAGSPVGGWLRQGTGSVFPQGEGGGPQFPRRQAGRENKY